MTGAKVISARLGYRFKNSLLIEEALQHRSAGAPHNERLEFLGDAVLDLILAEHLFERVPQASEGELTRLRARVVNRQTLADVARSIDLGTALALGPGEVKSGGQRRASTLANGFEALAGAIYLDSGIEAVRERILPLLEGVIAEAISGPHKDPKTSLQELLQKSGRALPEYRVVEQVGKAHAPRFTVECRLADEQRVSIAIGGDRRGAEQAAAQQMLEQLNNG